MDAIILQKMKKILLLIIILGMCGCYPDYNLPKDIYGTYKSVFKCTYETLSIQKDGFYIHKFYYKNHLKFYQKGKWKLLDEVGDEVDFEGFDRQFLPSSDFNIYDKMNCNVNIKPVKKMSGETGILCNIVSKTINNKPYILIVKIMDDSVYDFVKDMPIN